jgi:hypothetical protein
MASDMHLTALALTGHRLVITSGGGFLGLALKEVVKNDVTAILYGCNFTVLLRPCGDKLLGSAMSMVLWMASSWRRKSGESTRNERSLSAKL